MGERQKYNLNEELLKANETLKGDLSLLGMSMLTQPGYNNSMRTVMFTSHLRQFVNLINPEFPRWFTNAENMVGKYSSGYKKVKHDVGIYKKVAKFKEFTEKPNIYKIFTYDRKRDFYDVITRQPVENLTEVFGYEYNTDVIDSYEEGDIIKKGTVLYRSTSYDDTMNYSYGKNVLVMYTLDPYTSEDAAVVSKSLANEMQSIETEEIQFGLNDNDYLLNLYGDRHEYRPLPKIGEYVSNGIIAAYRRQYNNQLLFDFKDNTLGTIRDGDQPIYGNGEILDIEILCNNPDITRTTFNSQILDYLDAQNQYYKEIYKTCKKIMKSGSNYSRDIDYLYKRSKEMLDTEKKWKDKDGDTSFSNIVIKILIKKRVGLDKGQKVTGRFGNKSVVATIRNDDEMPYDENGRRVDLLLNLLAIINRTTAGPLYEMSTNFICNRTRERMKSMKSFKDKESLLFDIIYRFNEKQCKEMKKRYDLLNKKEKEEYIQSCIDDGIYIHQPPLNETIPIMYRLIDIYKTYDWLKPYKIYINKWGRKIRCLNDVFLGEMYILKLKQTSRKGYSARSSGAINTKELPERSYKSKAHMERDSKTAIRFGEFETLNFSIGILPEDIALFHAIYRTSIKGRKDLAELMLNPKGKGKIDASYTSRVAEIFNVILKSLSLSIEFIDDENELKPYSGEIGTYDIDGVQFLCTEFQFMMIQRIKMIESEILKMTGIMESEELENRILEELKARKYVVGPDDENEIKEILDLIR